MKTPAIENFSARPSYEVRGALTHSGDGVSGWCWSPQHPNERLRVEILVNDHVVASGVAARLQLERVRPGVSDGYHGFFLTLPLPLPANALLEARESGTGYVFARLLSHYTTDVADSEHRISTLSLRLERLHRDLGEVALGDRHRTLSTALAVSGAFLKSKVPPLAHQPHPVRSFALRSFAAPKWSILLDVVGAIGSSDTMVLEEVKTLAPLIATSQAELLVVDDGRVAATLTAVPGLHYCRISPGLDAASRINQAVWAARGEHLAVFRGTKASIAARAGLLQDPHPRRVVIGALAVATARAAGLGVLCPIYAYAGSATGLNLLAPREAFTVVGPLDSTLEDGADLPVLDFALRALAADYSVSFRQEPLPSPRPLAADAALVRAKFIQRWAALGSQLVLRPFAPC